MQKFYSILHLWLSVLATLLCSIYLILDVAMTLDGNGLWYFYSIYGFTSVPFSVSVYTGSYILICMFSFLIIFISILINPRKRLILYRIHFNDAKVVFMKKIAWFLSIWMVSMNLVLLAS